MIKFYEEINETNILKIYSFDTSKEIDFVIPNSYYINPKGFLYNCMSENGDSHKETTLIYPYRDIKNAFYRNEYQCIDGFHTIRLEELLQFAIDNYNRIVKNKKLDNVDIKCYLNMLCIDYDNPLLMKLILGIITSKIALLEKFIEIKNESKNLTKTMDMIIKESNDDINDILVRLCGFHKIESQVVRTITTTSLNLESFRNYLDKDFKLSIISPIMLNGDYDDFYKQVVIDRFIEKNPEYDGKILTRKLT